MNIKSIQKNNNIRIRSQVVEGIGLIIRFSMRHRWFKSSRMQFIRNLSRFEHLKNKKGKS